MEVPFNGNNKMKKSTVRRRELRSAKMEPSLNIEGAYAKQFEIDSNLVNDHGE